MKAKSEIGFHVLYTDGSVSYTAMDSIPERYDLTREIGTKTITEMPFFSAYDSKSAKAFYAPFSNSVNSLATDAFVRQYEERWHNKPKSKLYGNVVIVTGALDDLAEIEANY